jgi:hypothetical protein
VNEEEVSTDVSRIFIVLAMFPYKVNIIVISSYERHVLLQLKDVYFQCGATQLSNGAARNRSINRMHSFGSCCWPMASIPEENGEQYF